MSTLKGVDLSHWNTGFNLTTSPAKFALIKATGTSMVDSQCDHFVSQAKSSAKSWGVYHFAYTGSDAEADHFVANTKGYQGKGILALDWEADAVKHGPAAAKNWLDRVHAKTGIKPVIYTSGSVLAEYDWSAVAKAGYGLWLARWSSSPGSPSPWGTLALWQYTDAHTEQGYRLDGDEFYGTASTWDKYAGKAATAPAPDIPQITVDGVWGSGTTKRLQQVLGTDYKDGKISRQSSSHKAANPGLTSGWEWDGKSGDGGSPLVKAIQAKVDVSKDGKIGPDTIKAMQRHYQTPVDGVVDHPSTMVKAMQKRLNAGKF